MSGLHRSASLKVIVVLRLIVALTPPREVWHFERPGEVRMVVAKMLGACSLEYSFELFFFFGNILSRPRPHVEKRDCSWLVELLAHRWLGKRMLTLVLIYLGLALPNFDNIGQVDASEISLAKPFHAAEFV